MRIITFLLVVLMLLSGVLFAEEGGDIAFKPANMDPVTFSHDYHVKTRGIKCPACHFSTFAQDGGNYKIKKEKLNKRDFCQHCHNGMKAFDVRSDKNCKRCHKK